LEEGKASRGNQHSKIIHPGREKHAKFKCRIIYKKEEHSYWEQSNRTLVRSTGRDHRLAAMNQKLVKNENATTDKMGDTSLSEAICHSGNFMSSRVHDEPDVKMVS